MLNNIGSDLGLYVNKKKKSCFCPHIRLIYAKMYFFLELSVEEIRSQRSQLSKMSLFVTLLSVKVGSLPAS